MSAFNEFGRLREVVVSHPADAFESDARIDRHWRQLNFTARPHLDGAIREFERFVSLLSKTGATVRRLPASADTTLDALYARDATLVTPRGVVGCHMGKAARRTETGVQLEACRAWGVPVLGSIEPPGTIEGGDLVWFDERTVAVGRGYRTNDAGIEQLRSLLPGVEVVVVPLPHWRGEADVFHLMSILSPVDADLAVVYSPLMPVPFREWLMERGVTFVEVPDAEFDSMGANVLALGPRHCVMLEGNSTTRARLEAAGARVATYRGDDISVKGGGGPTCLTRPLVRD